MAIGVALHLPEPVVAVVTLATQSAGCEHARLLERRPLLLIHGEEDEVIPTSASETVRVFAGWGEVVVLPGADHRLAAAAGELRRRLPQWILGAFEGAPEPF